MDGNYVHGSVTLDVAFVHMSRLGESAAERYELASLEGCKKFSVNNQN